MATALILVNEMCSTSTYVLRIALRCNRGDDVHDAVLYRLHWVPDPKGADPIPAAVRRPGEQLKTW